MVPAADTEKLKLVSGKKVSKPLMEKKRRARINKCLDQLKTLLETSYSNNIRKRKLEKADILELTVRHLRHLQKNQRGMAMNSDFTEYQAGFRSCLAGVDQYLLMTDIGRRNRSDMLIQLSSRLPRSGAQHEHSSTVDSDTRAGNPPNIGAQRRTAKMVEQASPADLPNCLGVPGNADRNPGHPSKTATLNATGKGSFSTVTVVATKTQKQDSCTEFSSRAMLSIEGQYNVKHLISSGDPYWRPW